MDPFNLLQVYCLLLKQIDPLNFSRLNFKACPEVPEIPFHNFHDRNHSLLHPLP